ncbi:MAG: [NiFe] hydrogenase metallocenter assembly protein HypC [Ignavibacteriae bacterium]|nr:MAG: [NiFe] hydrogenase metallocenter assembly protein HypC [Ignavibacteriota bacterium]
MCLAIPGKIIKIQNNTQPLMGKVSFSGIVKDVCLEWVPEAKIGDYVIVHVGFALSIVDEKEAEETLKLFKQIEETQNREEQNEL